MLLEMKNITHFFGGFQALTDVNLSIDRGEIFALLGENGAGKSTLMNILGGVLQSTQGEIWFDGERLSNYNPKIASQKGIRFVHQELNVFNDMRVYENLFAAEEITKGPFLDKKQMIQLSQELLDSMGITQFSPTDKVMDLDMSDKQVVEIAKAIRKNCKLVILDEPTSALSNSEIDRLMQIMRKLKASGISIIYISHKMPEIFEICDRYTVMRNGYIVDAPDATGFLKDINEQRVTELMIGKKLERTRNYKPLADTDVILRAEDICYKNHLQHVSFDLRQGEILAFTGLSGDGRSELSEILFGARAADAGKIAIYGQEVTRPTIQGMMKHGIGMVQRNRKERSILPDMSILNNGFISYFNVRKKGWVIREKSERRHFEEVRKRMSIKAGASSESIMSLSGGNQQKVIFARWIETQSKILILDNPTQGIDVGTKFDFYAMMNQMAEQGTSILLFSNEIRELQEVANRCFVMYKGEIRKTLTNQEIDEETIMYYATGSDQIKMSGEKNND